MHGKDLLRTRRLTTGALQSATVINKSLKEFHALSAGLIQVQRYPMGHDLSLL